MCAISWQIFYYNKAFTQLFISDSLASIVCKFHYKIDSEIHVYVTRELAWTTAMWLAGITIPKPDRLRTTTLLLKMADVHVSWSSFFSFLTQEKSSCISEVFTMEDDEYENLPTERMSVHLIAGGMAGMMEHCVMYPVDCVKVSKNTFRTH